MGQLVERLVELLSKAWSSRVNIALSASVLVSRAKMLQRRVVWLCHDGPFIDAWNKENPGAPTSGEGAEVGDDDDEEENEDNVYPTEGII